MTINLWFLPYMRKSSNYVCRRITRTFALMVAVAYTKTMILWSPYIRRKYLYYYVI